LRCRKIGTFERLLVAAPAYLDAVGPLHHPNDLVRCDFVRLSMLADTFVLHHGQEEVTVRCEQSRLLVNSISSARSALLAGLGLQKLPLLAIADDLAAGRLVRVLPQWSLSTLNIYAVWPPSSHRNGLVKRLLEVLLAAK